MPIDISPNSFKNPVLREIASGFHPSKTSMIDVEHEEISTDFCGCWGPLEVACYFNNINVVRDIYSHFQSLTLPAASAAARGNNEIINFLVKETYAGTSSVAMGVALGTASKYGQTETVSLLLQNDYAASNLSQQNLIPAIENEHLSTVDTLLKNENMRTEYILQEDITSSRGPGYWALAAACRAGSMDIIERLLEIPEVESSAHISDNAALYYSLGCGNINVTKRILGIKKVEETLLDSGCDMAANAAVIGDIEALNLLLQYPKLKDYVMRNGNEVLRVTAEYGYTDIVLRLLEIEEVRNSAHHNNNAPLYYAALGNHTSIVHALTKIEKVKKHQGFHDNYRLTYAVESNNVEEVNRLLDIDLITGNVANYDDRAFIGAINNGSLVIFDKLQKLSTFNNHVHTSNVPLKVAIMKGHLELTKRLLNIHSIKAHAMNNGIEFSTLTDNPVLKIAAKNGDTETVNLLLDIPQLMTNEIASLWLLRNISEHKTISAVKRLLEIDETRQGVAESGYSIMRKAAMSGHLEIVNILLEIPEVLNEVTYMNNDFLADAASRGHVSIVNRLLEIPAVLENSEHVNIYRALRRASENNHYEVAYILARAQWPSGVKDIPQNLRECTPAIRKGEIMVNERDAEATQLLRWLQVGYIPTSRKDLYLPPRLSSKELQETTTLDFDVMNIVNKYAGTQRSIDTSRPTNEELTMISIKGINLLKASSSIMNRLEKARIEREENEHSCNNQAMIPYSRLGLN